MQNGRIRICSTGGASDDPCKTFWPQLVAKELLEASRRCLICLWPAVQCELRPAVCLACRMFWRQHRLGARARSGWVGGSAERLGGDGFCGSLDSLEDGRKGCRVRLMCRGILHWMGGDGLHQHWERLTRGMAVAWQRLLAQNETTRSVSYINAGLICPMQYEICIDVCFKTKSKLDWT